jgi:enhancing lycopene biosynthesis protein 2
MAKIGVCLSGCGVNDGAEIHESVITALTLDRAGAEIIYTAPDVAQTKVVNHITGDEMNETRNVLVESARIARGDITDLAQLTSDDMDALLFPGGFGAALNLCDFAVFCNRYWSKHVGITFPEAKLTWESENSA